MNKQEIVNNFVSKYLGQRLDFDGYYGTQCVDLFNYYLKEVLGINNPIQQFSVASAYQIWNYGANNSLFKRIENTPTAVPEIGDIIIFDKSNSFPHGHVSIFLEGDAKKLVSLDQHFPLGSPVAKVTHDYLNPKVIGWLRPAMFDVNPTLPPVNNLSNLIQKFTEIFSKLDGQKTYITVMVIVLTVIGYKTGYISDETLNIMDTLFLALLGFSLRDAIKKK